MLPLLGPLAGVAGIIGGVIMSKQRREEEAKAKEAEAAAKIEQHEVENYASKGMHHILQPLMEQGMYPHLKPDYLGRAYERAQLTAESAFADPNNFDANVSAGLRPTGRMGMGMAMMGQPGAPMGMPGQQPQAPPPPVSAQMAQIPWSSEQASMMPPQAGQMPSLAPTPAPPGQGTTPTQMTLPPLSTASPRQANYGDPTGNRGTDPLAPMPTDPTEITRVQDQFIAPPVARPQLAQAAPTLQFPQLKKPISRTVEGLTGKTTITDEGTKSGPMTQELLSQARTMHMPPDQFEASFNQWAIAQKGKAPELDRQQILDYKDEWFNRGLQAKVQAIKAATPSAPDALVQQMAAREMSASMGHYVPQKGGGEIAFSPEERQLANVNVATQQAAQELEVAMRIAEAGGTYNPSAGQSFANIIDNSPTMAPEMKQQVKQQFAQQIFQRLTTRMDPADPMGRVKAMLTAAHMTKGAVPHEWQAAVMGNPKEWGFTEAEASMYRSGKYNVFEPGGVDRLRNAVADEAIKGKLVEKAISEPGKSDVLMQAAGKIGQGSTEATIAGMGRQARAIDVQQREAESVAGTRGTKTEERRQVVEQAVQPLSELTHSLKRFIDTPITDVEGKTKSGKLYKAQLQTFRSVVAKGVLLQSGALNELEQEAAVDAFSSLTEAELAPDIAQEKIHVLNRILTKAFGKPVDLLADDPLNPQVMQALRFDRHGNPVGDTATRLAGQPSQPQAPPTAVTGPQPVAPPQAIPGPQPVQPAQPIAPAQMTPAPQPTTPAQPAQPPQSALPPIEQTAQDYKQRFPQEARPKVGPGSTAAAASKLPQEMTSKLQHQDKIEIATALNKYKSGALDEAQLEVAVAKVYGRFLTGKPLNEAVEGTMSVMRKSRKATANAAR